jgi:hypothetical protein
MSHGTAMQRGNEFSQGETTEIESQTGTVSLFVATAKIVAQ